VHLLLVSQLVSYLDCWDLVICREVPGRFCGCRAEHAHLAVAFALIGKSATRPSPLSYSLCPADSSPLLPRLQLIRVCADHGQVVSALNVYEWMKAPRSAGGAALTPTVYTYTAAMRAALSANMLDKAMQIWSDCEGARCRPDCRLSITYIEVSFTCCCPSLACTL
jgi:pentatricopeptide repeat protein